MNLFYDSVIFLYLIASITLTVGMLRDRKRPDKRENKYPTITLAVSILLCFSALVVFWGSFVEPRLITVKRVSIDLPNFEPTRPVRAALISDIQVGDYKKSGWVRKVAAHIKSLNPDLVLMAGDIIQHTPEHAQYLSGFRPLSSVVRTYAVLGDHDYNVRYKLPFSIDEELARTVGKALTDVQVQVLRNEARAIELHGALFTLVGLDDWLARKTVFPPLGGGAPPPSGGPIVVLVHNPDFILDPPSKNADLILAGNTHGGQIRLPFIGPIGRWNSKLPRTFDEGLFDITSFPTYVGDPSTPLRSAQDDKKRWLFITSGVGESGPRARLFNPPEIVLIELF